jgi:hypothetical protein
LTEQYFQDGPEIPDGMDRARSLDGFGDALKMMVGGCCHRSDFFEGLRSYVS